MDRVIGIIISIMMIIGGLSGEFVLRNTDSSVGLVIFGVILLAWNTFGFVMDSKYKNDYTTKKININENSTIELPTFLKSAKKVK